jgi:ComF family protein
MFTDLTRGILDLVYPPACRLCDRLLGAQADFCLECRRELLTDPFPNCPRCGGTVGPHANTVNGCFHCRDDHFSFARVIRVGPHVGLRRDLVIRAKTDEAMAEAAASIFAEGIGCKLAGVPVDGVIGVPLHWYRAWHRKYNQSVLLARSLAAAIGSTCWNRSLRRVRPTPLQTSLTGTARRLNVRDAFRAKPRGLQGKTIVLTDDVLTTGATADAAAKALLAAGAKQVIVAVLSHG